jgi:hypothetical protein
MHPLETYLRDLRTIHTQGVAETSGYGPLATLLNEIGATLKPRVRCIINTRNQGAGIPDGGLFTPDQLSRDDSPDTMPLDTLPSRGVIEVKSTKDDVQKIARSDQVAKYLAKYGQVLVTNYCDFLLVGRDQHGNRTELEAYRLADSEAAFWSVPLHQLVEAHADAFSDYLRRVMLSNAPLTSPQDVAWFLASYARDARRRVERAGDLPALAQVRQALEESLGIAFQDEQGDHFFRSTLVQTLFYGVFSAWVLWHNEQPGRDDTFNWHDAAYYLHVPVLQSLFEQVSLPSRLKPLGLVEVLDWTGAALKRVDRPAFFASFDAGLAVQYFYEPFLEAFDPELRRQLGVWYTPPEVVRYMVQRVDQVLRSELGVADGLADPQVHILDPCCGTGAYLVEVLRSIEATLKDKGDAALLGEDVKQAALKRVFGFELLPAPFVVAHLQLGLLLQQLGAPLTSNDRASIYLTNALTGWEPPDAAKEQYIQQQLQLAGLPELHEERDAAEHVKRDVPILVILGNPPYNGYAGLAMGEERDLSNAYRTTRHAPAPQGQGLNDLYVRFYRMAERRIVEQSGRGVVCYISNYSWLDGLSFTGMRERYLEAFDTIWIDCLNGDKYKTGKVTPDGHPDPSIFSTDFNREGIQVGTAIATLLRREAHASHATAHFRHFWGTTKRAQLEQPAAQQPPYEPLQPALPIGLPLMPANVAADYLAWPLLPDLFPATSPGVNTSRDMDLVDIDRERLTQRMQLYFDPEHSNEEVRKHTVSLMTSSGRYDAEVTRQLLIKRGMETGHFVQYAYRPFDTRYMYWHPETKLLDEKRESLFGAFQAGNRFLISRQKAERQTEGTPFYATPCLPDRHLTRPGSACFPLYLSGWPHQKTLFDDSGATNDQPPANLSPMAREYLASLGIPDPEAEEQTAGALWFHALAIGHSSLYLDENAGALRQDWPRIPLPASREALLHSAELGRQVAALLDPEQPVAGVTSGSIRPELKAIGVLTTASGGQINTAAGDLELRAGWGYAGRGGITMPGRGRAVQRAYAPDEQAQLGATTFDIALNDAVYWRNIPEAVWQYTLGGYQVLKKWLSYRELPLLGRSLSVDEAREVTQMARRIAAILLLEPELDASYTAVKAGEYRMEGEGEE